MFSYWIRSALEYKNQGNEYFKKQNYHDAIQAYSQAIGIFYFFYFRN